MEENKKALLEEMRQSYEMVRFFDNQYFKILSIFSAFYLGSIGYLLKVEQNIPQFIIFIFWIIFILIYIVIKNNSEWNLKNWGRINILRRKLGINDVLPTRNVMDGELSRKLARIDLKNEDEIEDFIELLVKKRGWRSCGLLPKSLRLWAILLYFLALTIIISVQIRRFNIN